MLSFLAGSRIGRRGFSPISKDAVYGLNQGGLDRQTPVFGSVFEAHGVVPGEADLQMAHGIDIARQRRVGFLRLRRAHGETSEVGSVLRHDDLFLTAFQSSTISSAAFDLGSVSTTPRPVEAAC
jgi:hypothetical protein